MPSTNGNIVADLLNTIPFRPGAIDNLNCRRNGNGELTCEVGLTGNNSPVPLRIKDVPDITEAKCTRNSNGDLVCEVGINGGERVPVVLPRDL